MSQEWVYVFAGWFRVDADAGCHDSTTSRHPPLEINAKCELLLQAPRVPSDKEWVLVLTPPPLPPYPILPGWESESGAMPTRNPYSVWLLGRQVHWNVWQLQLCGNKLLCNTQTSQEGATPAELSSNQAQTQTQVQTPTHTEWLAGGMVMNATKIFNNFLT